MASSISVTNFKVTTITKCSVTLCKTLFNFCCQCVKVKHKAWSMECNRMLQYSIMKWPFIRLSFHCHYIIIKKIRGLFMHSPELASSDFLYQTHNQQPQYTASQPLPADPSLIGCTHQLDGCVSVIRFIIIRYFIRGPILLGVFVINNVI
jgi:hypothetical protein